MGLQEYNSRTRETELEQEIKQLKQVHGAGQGVKRPACSICLFPDTQECAAAPGAPTRGADCGSSSTLLSGSPGIGEVGSF